MKHATRYQTGKYIFINRHGAKTPCVIRDNGLVYSLNGAQLGCTMDELKRDDDRVVPVTSFITNGPWGVADQCNETFEIYGPSTNTLATVYNNTNYEGFGNAQLIAAAPEMLTLLKNLVFAEDNATNGFSLKHYSTAVRAMIAAATGEA